MKESEKETPSYKKLKKGKGKGNEDHLKKQKTPIKKAMKKGVWFIIKHLHSIIPTIIINFITSIQ